MTLRLIVAVLALFASLPATAAPACHAAPAAMMHAQGHAPAKQVAPDAHVCVGCAALGDWLRPAVAAPPAPRRSAPMARIARLDPGRMTSPALPPPRMA